MPWTATSSFVPAGASGAGAGPRGASSRVTAASVDAGMSSPSLTRSAFGCGAAGRQLAPDFEQIDADADAVGIPRLWIDRNDRDARVRDRDGLSRAVRRRQLVRRRTELRSESRRPDVAKEVDNER